MNKTLIAAAVSAALMAPVAAQADVTVYGRIHNGFAITNSDKPGSDSTTDLNGAGGRFGIKASSDLGNGLTASAHYEFNITTDEPGKGVNSTRVATVSLSGSFGSVDLGVKQWGAYYANAGYLDPTYRGHGILYYDFGGPTRTSNTISYSNSFGPVSIQLDSRIDDSSEVLDGYAVGATVQVNDMISVSAAVDDGKTVTPATKAKAGINDAGTAFMPIAATPAETSDRTLTALQAVFSLGDYWASISRHSNNPAGDGADPSLTQVWVGGSRGNVSAMLGMGQGDYDKKGDPPGNDPSGVTLGVYYDMGGGLTLMYEGGSVDVDGAAKLDGDDKKYDSTSHWFGMMYNF